MASSSSLFDDEDDDKENDELLEFYHQNLMDLNCIPLSKIDPSVLRRIAEMLHSGLDYGESWREYGYCFGIKNYYELDTIKQKAAVWNELPLYMALDSVLRQKKSIGFIFTVLKSKKRLDVLRLLKSDINELLSEKCNCSCSDEALVQNDEYNSSLTFHRDSVSETVEIISIPSCHLQSSDSDKKVIENEMMQKHSSTFSSNADKSSNANISAELSNLSIYPYIPPKPSAPKCEKLQVFIMHTNQDACEANKLTELLREENIDVLKYSDIELSLMVDSVDTVTSVFSQVDFIIPIVSIDFLQQIHPKDIAIYIESEEIKNNRILYQLLLLEYKSNRCLNLRVRPLLVPGFDKKLLRNNLILSASLRLWAEVPKLVDILHKSKEALLNLSSG